MDGWEQLPAVVGTGGRAAGSDRPGTGRLGLQWSGGRRVTATGHKSPATRWTSHPLAELLQPQTGAWRWAEKLSARTKADRGRPGGRGWWTAARGGAILCNAPSTTMGHHQHPDGGGRGRFGCSTILLAGFGPVGQALGVQLAFWRQAHNCDGIATTS